MHYHYTCGAENETIPGLCGRPVSGPRDLCCCHGPGSCGHRASISISWAEPAAPNRWNNNDRPSLHDRHYHNGKRVIPKEDAYALVADIITDNWKSAVADKVANALNSAFWENLPRRQRRRKANCKVLAELATFMESSVDKAHDAVGAIANWGLSWLGAPALERSIAVAFAKKIPLPGQDQIAATVQSIRIYGVFLCVSEGLNIIDQCPCFWKLAQDKSKEELEPILKNKLDALEITRQYYASN